MSGQDFALFGIKVAFSLAAIILIVVYLVRPVMRSLRSRPDFLESATRFDLRTEMEEDELEIPSENAKPDRTTMIEQVRADPRKTAVMISQWLKQKK
jgi:flagellar biosynthesis/type III secretory pathway M-ring protein FliF/YscJ